MSAAGFWLVFRRDHGVWPAGFWPRFFPHEGSGPGAGPDPAAPVPGVKTYLVIEATTTYAVDIS
jgi:hypothetical protein